MFTGVENCARTPPMLFPVEPLPWELSRSMTRTLPQPDVVRCQAILEPTIPPPTMTTSALCMLHHVYDNYSVEVTPKNAPLEEHTNSSRHFRQPSPSQTRN